MCISLVLCSCSQGNSSTFESDAEDVSSDKGAESYDESQPEAQTWKEKFDIKERVTKTVSETMELLEQDSSFDIDDETVGEDISRLYEFTNKTGCYPVYKSSQIKYYPMGEQAFEAMLEELEKAESFIFFEYFIVNEGQMWDKVYDVLKRKASQGVEVRVMYDGLMDGISLPEDFPKRLEADGIKCHVFSSFNGEGTLNTRDHRKILIIDGKTTFTGGMNIADEYVNITHPYGIWKDNAIMIKGKAVESFTIMFLQIWCAYEAELDTEGYINITDTEPEDDGYIMPFAENPFDEYAVAKSFYISILDTAKDYVYIITPYLLPDSELEGAIISAAQRGVDVRVYLPSVTDMQAAKYLNKTHYRALLNSGVRIFEYNKGFVHSKAFLSDDIKSIVGTINLDNRSLVFHFECAAYIYKSDVIDEIKKEFTDNNDDYTEITVDDLDSWSEAGGYILKGFEGLL